MTDHHVQDLVKKFFRKECSQEEKEELARWIDQSSNDFVLRRVLEDAWKDHEPLHKMSENKSQEILSSILGRKQEVEPQETPVRVIWFKRIAVASMIAALVVTGGYYMFFNQPASRLAKVSSEPFPVSNEIIPGKTHAILTLADGSTVALAPSMEKTIAKQGATEVANNNGELIYNSAADHSVAAMYNSLNTRRGELYPLTLSDGTKVWLNSASSLHFPVAFNGSERVVDLTGEAYFEVAKNPAKPFKVNLDGMKIEVLGTHFNINGYTDEPVIRTTLIEGSLRVTKGSAGVLLAPGQQAGLQPDGKIELIKNVDTTEAVSWKNGIFHFHKTSLENVMRQFSRWYNVEVEFEGKPPVSGFTGDFRTDSDLSDVVKILETSQVHCKIVGRKIIVLNKEN